MAEATKTELYEKALGKLLRPVARAMISLGLPLNRAVVILKRALVDEAEAGFPVDGKPPTDSRISVLTGVHRKDVKALRSEPEAPVEKTRNSILSTVIARWLADPAYRGGDGRPSLPRLSSSHDEASFNTLVSSVASDVRPRTVLDALIIQGAVTLDADTDRVTLDEDAYVPNADEAETFRFFANNLHDHLAAATSNIFDEADEKFLERAVFYSNLSEASIARLKADVEARAMDALLEINEKALEHQRSDTGDDTATRRFRFGVFFYSDDESDPR